MHFKKIVSAVAATIMTASMIGGTGITASAANYCGGKLTDVKNSSSFGLEICLESLNEGDTALHEEIRWAEFKVELTDSAGNYLADILKFVPNQSEYRLFKNGKELYLKKNCKYYIKISDPSGKFMPTKIGYECTAQNDVGLFYNQFLNTSSYTSGSNCADFTIKMVKWGDVNYDGKVNERDYAVLQQAFAGWNTERPFTHEKISLLSSLTNKEYLDERFMQNNQPGLINRRYEAYTSYINFVNGNMVEIPLGKDEDSTTFYNRVRNNYLQDCTYGYSPADVDGNGRVNQYDLARFQQYLAGWNVNLGK